jgi:multidrug efflux system membrane fusion protein
VDTAEARLTIEKLVSSGQARAIRVPSRKWMAAGAGMALAVLVLWHFASVSGSGADHKAAAAAPVRVAKVERQDMPVVEHALGTVMANTMVQVTARVQGILDAAYFKEGQFVKKGDLLFQIDPRGFEAALAQSQAALRRDEAQLRNAVRDKQRYQSLHDQGAISDQLRDTSATNAEMLAGTVALDKAAVQATQLTVGYTQIRSPVDGKTGPLLVQPGNMVSATGTTPLVTIAQIQPVKVSFNLPESDLPRIQARQRAQGVTATIDSQGARAKPLVAPVDFTSNAVNDQSGTIELRATFDNADLSLVPGQLVNIDVELDNFRGVLIVPHNAVNDGPNGSYVYIVSEGKAVSHTVKILFDDTKNAAVESDIRRGDRVIVEGQLRVENGGAVRMLPPANIVLQNGVEQPPGGAAAKPKSGHRH